MTLTATGMHTETQAPLNIKSQKMKRETKTDRGEGREEKREEGEKENDHAKDISVFSVKTTEANI